MQSASEDTRIEVNTTDLHEHINDCDYLPVTYTTLTTLQPLSPNTDRTCASTVQSFDSSMLNSAGRNDDLSCYNFLEPLMPIAMLDDSGNVEQCPSSDLTSLSPLCHTVSALFASTHVDLQFTDTYLPSTTILPQPPPLSPAVLPMFQHSRRVSFDTQSSSSRASSPDFISRHPAPNVDLSPITYDSEDELDTRDIAERVSNELKRFNISQVQFAQSVLGRSQGTLSDLLRNPKPWDKLKSGRETFARMKLWLDEPETKKLASLTAAATAAGSNVDSSSLRHQSGHSSQRRRHGDYDDDDGKRRLVFTEAQRQILQRAFSENCRPDRHTQLYYSQKLSLPLRSVSNFFTNARRRSRYRWQNAHRRSTFTEC